MELRKGNYQFYDPILEKSSVCEETADAIVPDSEPDILRLIGSWSTASVKDETLQEGRLVLSGAVKTTVLYEPEKEEGVRTIEVPIHFAHIEEGTGIAPGDQSRVLAEVVGTETRLINPRKVSVSVFLNISCLVMSARTLTLTQEVEMDDPGLQCLKTQQSATLPIVFAKKTINLMEEIPLPAQEEGMRPVEQSAAFHTMEEKIVAGKVVLRGEVEIKVLALTPENRLEPFTASLPFHQILDADGLTEEDRVLAAFQTKSLTVGLQEGQMALSLTAECSMLGLRQMSMESIGDVYHTARQAQAKWEEHALPVRQYGKPFQGECLQTVSLGMRLQRLLDITCHATGISVQGGMTQVSCTAQILLETDDQALYAMTRNVEMEFPIQQTDAGRIEIVNWSVKATPGEDAVNLTLRVDALPAREETVTVRDLAELTLSEEMAEKGDVALVLKRLPGECRLWDLAKEYRTTAAAICEANEWKEDCVSASGPVVLIPVV